MSIVKQAEYPGTSARSIFCDVSNFDNNLSGTDTDLQTALDTLDESAGGISDSDAITWAIALET